MESEVVADAEVEVGAQVELTLHTDGWSDPLVIHTTCRLCYLVDMFVAELDTFLQLYTLGAALRTFC